MSPKKTSRAGAKPVGADPSGEKNADEPGNLPAANDLEKTAETSAAATAAETTAAKDGESYDDSLDAILLQAGARPPQSAAAKALGSKTLMGIGIDSLNLAGFGRTAAADQEDQDGPLSGDLTPTVEAKTLASAAGPDDTQVSSLLDEVAEALNVQASEYRDRARGKLPGMPGQVGAASPPPAAAAPRPFMALTDGAEFEDPDDGPTSLTPGVIFVPDAHKPEDLDLIGVSADREVDDEAVVLGPAGANKSPPSGIESRTGKLPPIPGLSGPVSASASVGPPPGAGRSTTPASGLPSVPASGRVRLPTPAPGTASLPPPPSGRLSLPPGMMSAPVIPGRQQSQIDLTATSPATPQSLEASRRISAALSGPNASRPSKHGSGHVTQPVIHTDGGLNMPAMPAVLAAQVKIATLSLAGLIAVTFAGGLLVGMLVWRGQGRESIRGEQGHVAGTAEPAPSAASHSREGTLPSAGVPKTAAAAAPAIIVQPPAAATPEVIVTPIAAAAALAAAADATPKAPPPRAAALRQPPRPRRPATTPTVADTAALFPKAAGTKPAPAAAPAPATASASPAPSPKTVASNSPAKPAPKAKGKSAWHDPFAD